MHAIPIKRPAPANIDQYIKGFPKHIQQLLEEMRTTIRKAAPAAEEAIKYAMPTFTLNGRNLVHFAAFKNHIGFYPAPSGIEAFKKELSVYAGSKGAIRFPLDKPLPFALVRKIVQYRTKMNLQKTNAKKRINFLLNDPMARKFKLLLKITR